MAAWASPWAVRAAAWAASARASASAASSPAARASASSDAFWPSILATCRRAHGIPLWLRRAGIGRGNTAPEGPACQIYHVPWPSVPSRRALCCPPRINQHVELQLCTDMQPGCPRGPPSARRKVPEENSHWEHGRRDV